MTRLSLVILLLALVGLTSVHAKSVRPNLRRRLEDASEAPSEEVATEAPSDGVSEAEEVEATEAPTEDERMFATESPETKAATVMPTEELTEAPTEDDRSYTEAPETKAPDTEAPTEEEKSITEAPDTKAPETDAPTEDYQEEASEAPQEEEEAEDPTSAPTQAPTEPKEEETPATPKEEEVEEEVVEEIEEEMIDSRNNDIAMSDGDDIFEINTVVTVTYFEGQGGEMNDETLRVFNERLEQLEAGQLMEAEEFGHAFAKYKMKHVEQEWDESSQTLTLFFTSHVELEAGGGQGQTPHKIARELAKPDFKAHIHTLMGYGQGGINRLVFTCTGTGERRRRR